MVFPSSISRLLSISTLLLGFNACFATGEVTPNGELSDATDASDTTDPADPADASESSNGSDQSDMTDSSDASDASDTCLLYTSPSPRDRG